jgi:hypothetical protein
MESMLRIADRFEFRIAAFHHALGAYKIAPELAKRNITAAIFPDYGGYKAEVSGRTSRYIHFVLSF